MSHSCSVPPPPRRSAFLCIEPGVEFLTDADFARMATLATQGSPVFHPRLWTDDDPDVESMAGPSPGGVPRAS